jgi:hypothetical protein
MNPQLQIYVCRTYLHEAETAAHLEQWPDVQIIPFTNKLCIGYHPI